MKFEYNITYEISRTSSILGTVGPRSWRNFEIFDTKRVCLSDTNISDTNFINIVMLE